MAWTAAVNPGKLKAGKSNAAKLSSAEKGKESEAVVFDFNPTTIRVDKITKLAAVNNSLESQNQEKTDFGQKKLTFSDVTFVGKHVKADVEQLIAWTEKTVSTGWKKGAKEGEWVKESRCPRLKFTWGTKWNEIVELHNVNSTYTRFASDGTPVRATVGLTMGVIKPPEKATNPTSGGLPDRTFQTLVDGDCLQLLAHATYGDPGLWRQLAAANNIEDPLRLRPGQSLYLPNESELFEEGTG